MIIRRKNAHSFVQVNNKIRKFAGKIEGMRLVDSSFIITYLYQCFVYDSIMKGRCIVRYTRIILI